MWGAEGAEGAGAAPGPALDTEPCHDNLDQGRDLAVIVDKMQPKFFLLYHLATVYFFSFPKLIIFSEWILSKKQNLKDGPRV